MDITQELLLNGALAFLIIKEVLQFVVIFLRKKTISGEMKSIVNNVNNNHQLLLSTINNMSSNGIEKNKIILNRFKELETDIEMLLKQSSAMYNWHDARDDDGVFVWYVRKSLAKSIDGVTTSLLIQNDALKQIILSNKELMKEYLEIYSIVRESQKSIEENRGLINRYKTLKEDIKNDLEKMPLYMKDCRDLLIESVRNEIKNEIRNIK